MYLQLLLLITLTFTTLQAITLQEAIEKSDVESVKKIVSLPNSIANKKIPLLDLAQETINKRREDIWLADIARPPFSAKGFQLTGFVVACIGGLSFIGQIIDYKNCKSSLLAHSVLGTLFGCFIFKLSHDYLENLDKQYQNAVAIKQLIYEA